MQPTGMDGPAIGAGFGILAMHLFTAGWWTAIVRQPDATVTT